MIQPQKDRHEAAARRAVRMDRRWFDRRPGVFLRLRASIPFEWEGWDADGHRKCPFVLLLQEDDGELRKRAFYAHAMPDQDVVTLATLWDFIEANVPRMPGGPMVKFDQVQNMQLAANLAANRIKIAQIRAGGEA